MVDLPVVWLETESVASAQSGAALEAWASARGARLVGFSSDSRLALSYPAATVTRVEQELGHARDATAALDGEAADASLTRAETELFAHPEIPQSAWLLAEILRGRAARVRAVAPKDEASAEAAIREARGLDGGRAAGIGEGDDPEGGLGVVDLWLDGAEQGDVLLDGRPSKGGRSKLSASPGRHHVGLAVGGRLVWASWTVVTAGAHLAVPSLRVPCSRGDFAGVILRGAEVDARRARCTDWVAARRSPGGLFVARCSAAHCGPLVEWRVRLPDAPLVPRYADRRVPVWATWGAIGAVAVVVAGVALVGAGAFETAPQTTRFSYGGVISR